MLMNSDTPTFTGPVLRELATRENDGITVRLQWRADDDAVLLQLDDAKLGLRFELQIAPEEALHAFEHPFAYLDDSDRCGRAITR